MSEIIHVLPADIEKTSFRIIEEELRQQGREIPEDKKHVILRVIHTTADFEYLDTLVFSESVLDKASDAIRRGAHIVTDTTMAERRTAIFPIRKSYKWLQRMRRPAPRRRWIRLSARLKRRKYH